ncbi:MAG: PLP-dependent aminotransferase family protein [Opitutales bacterium]
MSSRPEQTPFEFPVSAMAGRLEAPVIADLMHQALANPDLLSLAAGFTDNDVLPVDLVRDTVDRLTGGDGEAAVLQYGTNRGRQDLREATLAFLRTYPGETLPGLDLDSAMVTNGSQQALYAAMQVLCDPGDLVLVEQPSYFVFLEMLKGLGIRPVGMPCLPEGGLDLELLDPFFAELARSRAIDRVRAVYLMGYHGNPTGRSVTAAEKEALAASLRAHGRGWPIIEDAAYRDLYFDEPHPVPSVLSLPAYAGFPCLYLGTYTKPFATGLKVGYALSSHVGLLDKMACVKGHQDFGTAHFNQAIVANILIRGLYPEFLAGLHRKYGAKARLLQSVLEGEGVAEAGWRWHPPAGGLLIWMRGPDGLDARMSGAFCRASIDAGVLYVPGDLCLAGGEPVHCLRLSFGTLRESRLEEAGYRFGRIARQYAGEPATTAFPAGAIVH